MADEKTPLLNSNDSSKTPLQVGFAPAFISGDKDEAATLVPVKQLFRFADRTDTILITLGVIGSICYGALTPAQFILFGKTTDDFVEFTLCDRGGYCQNSTVDLEDSMTDIAAWYLGFAVGNFLFAWMGLGLFALSAERQVHKMRLAMFKNVIYQEIGWFDEHSSGELITRLTDDLRKVTEGIGAKFGRYISNMVAFLAGYVIGFSYVWQLTSVMLATLPLLALTGAVMVKITESYTTKELEAYSKAGHVAEQSFSSIRTVASFGGEEKQAELYDQNLGDACKFGIKKGFGIGIGLAAFMFVSLSNYGLSAWYINKLVRDNDATAGDGMTVFFAVSTGSAMLGQIASSIEALAAAKSAAYVIFNIIDRKSQIDASSSEGLKPAVIKGDIELSSVNFVYPTRQSVQVMKEFSLNIPSGKQVALVGESGCGKSTVVKLIQRFYDPVEGSVMLDGEDIKNLNVHHLRKFIGVVNQEPVLFSTTIAENISYGHEGVTQQEIEEAAKMANAHNFITQFPKGYDTLCGERGAKMSGGQKQRIAIARALVRNPKILLLDEATSALDSESEAVVQDALEKAAQGRTTVIIAHRLSTIKNADIIVAVNDGRIAEMGTHDELMALDGLYNTLVKLQGKEVDKDDEDDQENDSSAEDEIAVEIGEDGAFKLGSLSSTVTDYPSKTIQADEDVDIKPVSLMRILKMNYPEWHYLVFGCFGAVLYGAYSPLYGVAFGKLYDAFSYDPSHEDQRDEMKDKARDVAIFYVLLGVGCGLGAFISSYYFSKVGETLTERIRKQAFLAYLRQDISYFDQPNHGTGAICTSLSSEISLIKGATGSQLGLLASGLVTVIGGLIVSFDATWQLTLVMLAFVPLLMVAGMMMAFHMGGKTANLALITAGQTTEEVLSNIQTVVSLGREDAFFEKYCKEMIIPYNKAKRASHLSGLAIGSFMGILCLSDAAAFRYGGYLVTEGDITMKEMMTSITTVIICAIVLGHVVSLSPDYAQAKQAANRVFYLLDRVPPIDSYSNEGKQPDVCNGEIELSNLRFSYPSRRNFKVLRNLSLTVKQGQTVALVGVSGCGKSTTVSLVERFYDVISGSVNIDGNDVKELNLKWLRSQIGIVSQEPVLFDLSVRDNIAYGDTTRNVSDKEVEEAAKSANIHQFISSLPQGYDTIVGDKGTLISGGQKQRIAIARALIRDPKILLLDEATSALDTESEKVVQHALDKASIGRTTLVIAHRLSTIHHADCIIVIKCGRVIERGTHQQLLTLNRVYYALHKAQSLTDKKA